jgi:ABC-type dipeptide/oligopeptide/nickel transport system permease subunit
MTKHEPPRGPERLRESGAAGGAVVGTAVLLDEAIETGQVLVTEAPIRSQTRLILRRFLRHRVAVAALAILLFVAALAIFINVVSPYEFNPLITPKLLDGARQGPSIEHLFGTDKLGRDMFTRVFTALQKSLQIGLGVALVSAVIGVTIGALAGYYRGWIDALLMRITDLVLVLPSLAVLLIIASNPAPTFFGLFDLPPATEVGGMVVILSLLGWMPMARIVRGEFLSLREKEFVEAAEAAGASGPRIIVRHLLPNAVGPIVVFATLEVGLAILEEATLSFLGAGIQLPDVSLGNLISEAEGTVGTKLAYLIIFPGLLLFLVVLCVNFVGDGLRDALDPKAVR